MKKILLVISIAVFLHGCKSVTEGFTLKKGNNADEFLVEKKNPLVLPPEFDELPVPDSNKISSDKSENENFKVTLDIKDKDKSQNKNDIKAKSTEESILKRIKKNDSN